MNEIIGWLGASILSICAVPQVVKTWKTKSAGDLSWLFLWFWFWGEILTLIYIVIGDFKIGVFHIPLYLNYVFNYLRVDEDGDFAVYNISKIQNESKSQHTKGFRYEW